MKRAISVLLGALVLGLIGATVPAMATAAPPSASPTATVTHRAAPTKAVHARVAVDPPGTSNMTFGGCGFLQKCVYFNKTEQKYIGIASIAGIVAMICAATAGVGCVVAVVIGAVASKYVDDHGLCPSSKPRLRVKIFPTVGSATCVK